MGYIELKSDILSLCKCSPISIMGFITPVTRLERHYNTVIHSRHKGCMKCYMSYEGASHLLVKNEMHRLFIDCHNPSQPPLKSECY